MNTINVSVPLTDVNKYFSHMNHLLKAHFELVRLIEVENKLKKHHRAYLHVRERIDQLIRETSPRIAEIAADVTAVMDRSFMVEIPEGIMSDCDCDNCPCCECDCDCGCECDCGARSSVDGALRRFPRRAADPACAAAPLPGLRAYVCEVHARFRRHEG